MILSQVVQVSTASFAGDMAVLLTWKPKETIKVATALGELAAESAILDSEVRCFPCLGACVRRRMSRRLDTEESGIRVERPQKIYFFGWVKFNLSGLRPFTLEDTTSNQELSNCPYTKGREGARPLSFSESQCSKLGCIRWQPMGFSRKFFFFLFCL